MTASNDRLLLYEALELRDEYDGRIKTLKGCLPEIRNRRDRLSFGHGEEIRYRSSPGFDLKVLRDQLVESPAASQCSSIPGAKLR